MQREAPLVEVGLVRHDNLLFSLVTDFVLGGGVESLLSNGTGGA